MKYKHLIDQMSLEEKASLMSGKNFWQTQNIDHLNIPSIFLADGPNGLRKQKGSADHLGLNESIKSTCFPTSSALANTWNPQLVEIVATALGAEAVAEKVSVVLGPGVNIKRNPLAGRNFEYYSEDPYLSGKITSAFVRGIQSNGIAASVKHFAANNQEYRRMSIDSVVDERTLREIYLTSFEMAVKEGKTKTIMASYNLVQGVYANENTHLLKDILRDEWGFEGVVVSDWGGINDRVAALKASSELEMPYSGGQTNQEIIEAVRDKKLDLNDLDQAIDRLLSLVMETHEALKDKPTTFDLDLHHNIAQKAAEEAIVLLKNDDHILPLKKGKKVAFIGDFARELRYQGAGSSGVNPTRLDSILDHIKETDLDFIGYEQGFHRYGKSKKSLTRKAVKLAEKADVVVCFLGLDEYSETEGLDRKSLSLPQNQLDLISVLEMTNPNVIVVLSCGSVIDTTFDSNVKALVHGYLLGQAGAKAILKVLSGEISPSGKLSESYPVKYEDVSSYSNFPGLENTVEYREALFVGYRYFDTAQVPVKYPFGHGLSYTTFLYDQLTVNHDGVSFILNNTGSEDAHEVVQLYVGKKDSKIMRPLKELKGFRKVFLKSGESKEIDIQFDAYSFRYFNVQTNRYEVEPGCYEIYVGSSSQDIRLTGSILIKAPDLELPNPLTHFPTYKMLDIHHVSDDDFQRLLGYPIPESGFAFYKKKRMKVDYNTTVQQLRYAKGWSGRFFSRGTRFGYKLLRGLGFKKAANVMQMALYHNPMRNMSRLTGGALTWRQLDGMILMFNGRFFKGLFTLIRKNKKQKKV